MKIKIYFFGQLAEITGKAHVEAEDIRDTDTLMEKIIADYPAIKKIAFRIAVNRKLIRHNEALAPGSEVALMPPFAGG
jgi:sulfur-carrier protein